jgi:hypothetical protein
VEDSFYKILTYNLDLWTSNKNTYEKLKTIMENRRQQFLDDEYNLINRE